MSQTRLAHATGQQQSEISEIISGRQVQSVALLERIADGLGVRRGWMGLAYDPDLEPELASPGEAPAEDKSNANLLRHATTVLLGAPVFGPADPIHITDDPTPVPCRIGPADIDQVATTTEQLSQLARDLGGIPMTEALTAHARTSEALLGAAMRDRQHFVRGMDCAGAGGDLLRAVLNLDRLGWLELGVAPNEALKLFQLGAAVAPSGLSRAVLEYNCARALGLLGMTGDAITALRRAHDTYQVASDEPRASRHFARTLTHIEGGTYFALGRFDRAAVALSAAVRGAGHAVVCTVTNSGLLAAAQLRCGEVGTGLATAGRVVRLAKTLRCVSVRENLRPLQEAAAARRDSACQDLARELATLRSTA